MTTLQPEVVLSAEHFGSRKHCYAVDYTGNRNGMYTLGMCLAILAMNVVIVLYSLDYYFYLDVFEVGEERGSRGRRSASYVDSIQACAANRHWCLKTPCKDNSHYLIPIRTRIPWRLHWLRIKYIRNNSYNNDVSYHLNEVDGRIRWFYFLHIGPNKSMLYSTDTVFIYT